MESQFCFTHTHGKKGTHNRVEGGYKDTKKDSRSRKYSMQVLKEVKVWNGEREGKEGSHGWEERRGRGGGVRNCLYGKFCPLIRI